MSIFKKPKIFKDVFPTIHSWIVKLDAGVDIIWKRIRQIEQNAEEVGTKVRSLESALFRQDDYRQSLGYRVDEMRKEVSALTELLQYKPKLKLLPIRWSEPAPIVPASITIFDKKNYHGDSKR